MTLGELLQVSVRNVQIYAEDLQEMTQSYIWSSKVNFRPDWGIVSHSQCTQLVNLSVEKIWNYDQCELCQFWSCTLSFHEERIPSTNLSRGIDCASGYVVLRAMLLDLTIIEKYISNKKSQITLNAPISLHYCTND